MFKRTDPRTVVVGQDHNTALHMAAVEGHAAVVDALIKARADIFMLDKVATKLPARYSKLYVD